MATEPGSITTVLRRGASCALQKPEQRFSVASVPQYPSKALDWATCLVVEVEVRGNCTRCVVTRTVKYNMIGCLWVHSAFVGRGDAAFCVKALGKFSSERMSCEEAEKGGPLRTSLYEWEERVEACHFSLQSDIAAWREIARTASMDAVSTKFGGGGAAAKLLAGAQRTEIFILGKMPRSLSAMLLNEIETDCVGFYEGQLAFEHCGFEGPRRYEVAGQVSAYQSLSMPYLNGLNAEATEGIRLGDPSHWRRHSACARTEVRRHMLTDVLLGVTGPIIMTVVHFQIAAGARLL
ncbi:hypothetical protein DFH94DRAFT_684341 [Russula ochroleuca]|uniref:Uncharacterized protein n=1 Tax=Russula ochroleuca TaxID=152965 RepID=A0A9P5MNB0_9AGAM|nr:hypothetical protein DFH94DRAFT_684341 [Russula ochroleuca]